MLNPNPSAHADPDVLTRFLEERARTVAMPGLAHADAALLPGLAGYHQGVATIPI